MEIGETEGESFMKLVWNWLGWDGHVRGMGERLGKGGDAFKIEGTPYLFH